MRRPRWDSGWNRPAALFELLLQPLLLPLNIILFGLSEARYLPRHWRCLAKTLWTGKQGPSSGIVW